MSGEDYKLRLECAAELVHELISESNKKNETISGLRVEIRELKEQLATINSLQSEEKSGIMQERKYIQDPKTGKMMGSTSDGEKIPKSMAVGKKERLRISHQIFTDFPSLKNDGKLHPYENRNHFYLFSVHEPGSYGLHYKIKIEGNESLISSIRKDFR